MPSSTHTQYTLAGQRGLDLADGLGTVADPASFRATCDLWSFGGVTVSELTTTAVEIRGVDEAVAPSWPGWQNTGSVVFLTDGDFRVTHESKILRFTTGSAAYLTDWSLLGITSELPSRVVIVTVPLASLRDTDALPSALFGGFAFSATHGSPLLSFAQAVLDVVATSPIPAEPTSTVLVKLVGQLFRDDRVADDTEEAALNHDLRLKADSLFAFHSRDRSFGALPLANQLEVTLEQLEANFQQTGAGETPQQAILDRRTMMAVLGLQSPAENARTSRDIAERAGFGVARELHKALKAAYGLTVRQVLRGQIEAADIDPRAGAAPRATPEQAMATQPSNRLQQTG